MFSIYLTESDHWTGFTPTEAGWTVQLHKTGEEESAVVTVVSDTAMMGLLLNQLSIEDAQELGMLVLIGDETNRDRVLAAVQEAMVRFHTIRIQSASPGWVQSLTEQETRK